jgi:hypothetical protein
VTDVAVQDDASTMVNAEEMATVLMEIYADLPHPHSNVEIMVSWLLHAYDR